MTDATQRQIARINELSGLARASWIGLLAYLAFVFVTLLGVEDADFFVPSRQTQLPLVNVAIPTASFFVFAPVLAAALYVYLHLFLLKLWDAFAEAPAQVRTHPERPEWAPLGDLVHPWLANDIALGLKGDGAGRDRPLQGMSSAVTRLLVWLAGPFVLFMFWWRSMPAHDEWLTLLIAGCFLVATTAGIASWGHARARIPADPKRRRPPPKWRRDAILVGTLLAAVSWLRTEHGIDDLFPSLDIAALPAPLDRIAGLATLARTDLANVELVPLPPDWRSPETARKAFRVTWCAREALAMTVCDHLPEADRAPPPHVAGARAAYCIDYGIGAGAESGAAERACTEHFAEFDDRFRAAWDEERRATIANLTALNLSGRDLRRADLSAASLVGADLRGARLDAADLRRARLEAVSLQEARMEGAELREARLERANLRDAHLMGTNLSSARLEGAELRSARMTLSDLGGARMEGADLRETQLNGAYLRGSQLVRANLVFANLEGVNLRGARLDSVDLTLTDLGGAETRWASFRDADWGLKPSPNATAFHGSDLRTSHELRQSFFDNAIGDENTLLPEGPSETGKPFFIWSCWETLPPSIDQLIEQRGDPSEKEKDFLRAEWLCGPDNPRRETGTP
jgi:uncharacterized protein YjbI with pentapeptide repeats